MAVPEDLTILNISGKFTMNKTLSDPSTDTILQHQGIGWFTRKAISVGVVTLHIKHYKDDDGIEHVNIEQTITGGLPGTKENRILTWTEKEAGDSLFGPYIGKTRRVKVEELDVPFLQEGWDQHTLDNGVIQSYVVSNTRQSGREWTANQTWGIQVVDGERRYVRHVKFTGPKGEDIEAKLYYDYLGPMH